MKKYRIEETERAKVLVTVGSNQDEGKHWDLTRISIAPDRNSPGRWWVFQMSGQLSPPIINLWSSRKCQVLDTPAACPAHGIRRIQSRLGYDSGQTIPKSLGLNQLWLICHPCEAHSGSKWHPRAALQQGGSTFQSTAVLWHLYLPWGCKAYHNRGREAWNCIWAIGGSHYHRSPSVDQEWVLTHSLPWTTRSGRELRTISPSLSHWKTLLFNCSIMFHKAQNQLQNFSPLWDKQ